MEKSAILHQSDSKFSFPVSDTKAVIRLRVKRDDDIKSVFVIWNTGHKFWQSQLRTPLEIKFRDALFDWYVGELDNGAPGYSYLFEITDGDGTVWYYNESGFDTVLRVNHAFEDNFTVIFPNKADTVTPNKRFEGRVFYQIFPERFARASHKTNCSYIDMDWNTDKPDNNHFAGGDLVGIREKLPYLKDLGIGAVYMTPVQQSASAHKYDIDDYFSVDRMFGSIDDLRALVKAAHELDIMIVMDLVFNHSGYYNPLFQDVVKNGSKSKYYHWYFVNGDKPDKKKLNYNTFADVWMMPKLNTNNPEVQDYLCRVGEFYLKECNVDGYRLDVASDVSHEFWRVFRARCKQVNPDVFIIGEHWQNAESFLGNDQWDSVMNYAFKYACERFFVEKRYDAEAFCNYLNAALMRYKDGTDMMMLNLVDSHDTPRFFELVGRNKSLELLTIAALMFYPGNPMIYYGDEIFMDGKMDPYNRKCMRWDSKEYDSAEHRVIRRLLQLRGNEVLKCGRTRIYEQNGLAIIERRLGGNKLSLAINFSGRDVALDAEPVYGYNCEGNVVRNEGFAVIG